MKPFTVNVPQARIERIWTRVREFEFPHAPKAPAWQYGTDADYLRRMQRFWNTTLNEPRGAHNVAVAH